MTETQLTSGPGGRVLTNCNVWSPDGEWIVYDTRSDPAGTSFDGTRIEAVHVRRREVRVLYESRNGANCGVATWHPMLPQVAFILGPELSRQLAPRVAGAYPEKARLVSQGGSEVTRGASDLLTWTYGPARRQGVVVDANNPKITTPLDARDLTPPFTPGALRGGSHVHVWNPAGDRVSFTYDDHILDTSTNPDAEPNQRNIGVSVVGSPVTVPKTHPRNHDGSGFSVLVSKTVAKPTPGSDELSRAFEEAWLGNRRLAFQGHVTLTDGSVISEVFLLELPDDLTTPGDGPLEGTPTRRPAPPRGVVQRRLTRTETHRFPGLSGPRHWLRSSPDGSRVGFLKADDAGVVQFWTVSPAGEVVQVTRNPEPVASAFTWHPDGRHVAFAVGTRVCVTDVRTGTTTPVTADCHPATAPRPEACVFSPDGSRIAFVRHFPDGNQIHVASP